MTNYSLLLKEELNRMKAVRTVPRLLLHSCCAPCSSYVLGYLTEYFDIVLFYYNPNISPFEEYKKRVEEQKRLLSEMPFKHKVEFVEGNYDHERFLELIKGLEDAPEGGDRCTVCFKMRLEEALNAAKEHECDYFTTTLSVSPHKSAEKLNRIGLEIAENETVKFLFSDFKKNDGYKKSIELSKQYNLYRQNYCGCVFSKRD